MEDKPVVKQERLGDGGYLVGSGARRHGLQDAKKARSYAGLFQKGAMP